MGLYLFLTNYVNNFDVRYKYEGKWSLRTFVPSEAVLTFRKGAVQKRELIKI
eukprot:UN00313